MAASSSSLFSTSSTSSTTRSAGDLNLGANVSHVAAATISDKWEAKDCVITSLQKDCADFCKKLTTMTEATEIKFEVVLTVDQFLPHLSRAILDKNYIPVCSHLMLAGIQYASINDIKLMCKMARVLPKLTDAIMLQVVEWIRTPAFNADLTSLFQKGSSNEELESVFLEVFQLCTDADNFKNFMDILLRLSQTSSEEFARLVPQIINEITHREFPSIRQWDLATKGDRTNVRLCLKLFHAYIFYTGVQVKPIWFEFLMRLQNIDLSESCNNLVDQIQDCLVRTATQSLGCLLTDGGQLAEIFLFEIINGATYAYTCSEVDFIEHSEHLITCVTRLNDKLMGPVLRHYGNINECLNQVIKMLGEEIPHGVGRKPINEKAIEYATIVLSQLLQLLPDCNGIPSVPGQTIQEQMLESGVPIHGSEWSLSDKRRLQADARLWVMLSRISFVTPIGQNALGHIGLLLKEKVRQRAMEVLSIEQVSLQGAESKEVVTTTEEEDEALFTQTLFNHIRNNYLEVTSERFNNFIINLPYVMSLWSPQEKLVIFARLLSWQEKPEYTAVSTLSLLALLAGSQGLANHMEIGNDAKFKIIEKMDVIIKLTIHLLRSEDVKEFRMGCQIAQHIDEIFVNENYLNSTVIVEAILENLSDMSKTSNKSELAKSLPLISVLLPKHEAIQIFSAGLGILLKNAEPMAIPAFCREFIANVSSDERDSLIEVVLSQSADVDVICKIAQHMSLVHLQAAWNILLNQRVSSECLANFMSALAPSHQYILLNDFFTPERTNQVIRTVSLCLANMARDKQLVNAQCDADNLKKINLLPFFAVAAPALPTTAVQMIEEYCNNDFRVTNTLR